MLQIYHEKAQARLSYQGHDKHSKKQFKSGEWVLGRSFTGLGVQVILADDLHDDNPD